MVVTAAAAPVQKPVRRKLVDRRFEGSGVRTAAEMIGRIEPGIDVVGLTNGQYSMLDIVAHVLAEIGPADVTISTWTMGVYDRDEMERFARNGQIRRIRFVVDPSIFARRPELSGALVEAFGPTCFRAVNTHAKFATMRSDTHAVAVRTSMNLNPNRRLENFDLSADDAVCRYFEAFVDDVFENFADERTQSQKFFEGILDRRDVAEADAEQGDERFARLSKTRRRWRQWGD